MVEDFSENKRNVTCIRLIACWVDMVVEEPEINNESFKADWETFAAKYEEENKGLSDFDILDKFFEEYDSFDWVVYEISNGGISCGPGSGTAWFVVDKDIIVEELDEDAYEEEDEQDDDQDN